MFDSEKWGLTQEGCQPVQPINLSSVIPLNYWQEQKFALHRCFLQHHDTTSRLYIFTFSLVIPWLLRTDAFVYIISFLGGDHATMIIIYILFQFFITYLLLSALTPFYLYLRHNTDHLCCCCEFPEGPWLQELERLLYLIFGALFIYSPPSTSFQPPIIFKITLILSLYISISYYHQLIIYWYSFVWCSNCTNKRNCDGRKRTFFREQIFFWSKKMLWKIGKHWMSTQYYRGKWISETAQKW